MKSCFFDERNSLRNGWKILGFLLLTALLIAALVGVRQLLPPSIAATLPRVLLIFVGVMAASLICVKLERQSLANLGVAFNTRFARQLSVGMSVGFGMLALVAVPVWLLDGFHLEAAADASLQLIANNILMMFAIATIETLLFCGYPFQRAIRGLGIIWAVLLFAVLFAAAHIIEPDTPLLMMIIAMLDIFLAGILFSVCYLKTRSLALAIGIHMGWNLGQALLGFGVSGNASKGWWKPVYHGQPDWLTGGSFGLEGSVISIVVLVATIALLARRKTPLGVPAQQWQTAW